MRKRVLILAVVLIALVCVAAALMCGWGIAGSGVNAADAELYVNGSKLKEPAVTMSWNVHFPFFSTLEALGCEVKADAVNGGSEAVIKHAGRTIVFTAQDSAFYAEEKQILEDVKIRTDRVKGSDGVLYMDLGNYQEVLHALGFNQITLYVNETRHLVQLTAQ